jgi:hypothetical protein
MEVGNEGPWPPPDGIQSASQRKRRTGLMSVIIAVAVLGLVGGTIGVLAVTRNGGGDSTTPDPPLATDAGTAADEAIASDEPTGSDETSAQNNGALGSRDRPAAFGTVFDLGDDWFATIVSVSDPGVVGLLHPNATEPAAGHVFVAVSLEVTYAGDEVIAASGITADTLGSSVPDQTRCLLSTDLTDLSPLTFGSGQTTEHSVCLEVIADEREGMLFTLENIYMNNDVRFVFSESSTATAEPPPIPTVTMPSGGPVGSVGNPAGLGAVLDLSSEWSATVTRVEDAIASGLHDASFGQPRPGNTFLAVTVEIIYSGEVSRANSSIYVQAVGSLVFESSCILDSTIVKSTDEFVPDQIGFHTFCFEVPASERYSLLYVIADYSYDPPDRRVVSESA